MMNAYRLKGRRIAGLGLAAILSVAGAPVIAQTNDAPETVIQNWPKELQSQARYLIEKYGAPSSSDANSLVWMNNGPWRKTILHREGFTKAMMGKNRDHLEQVVAFAVPEDKIADLQRFDKRISVNQATDEVSSHADTESMNYLALNLADDIVKGERTVQGARAFYRKTKMLEKTGKSSPYLDGLLFAKDSNKASDPAKPAGSPDMESGSMESEEPGSSTPDASGESVEPIEPGSTVPEKDPTKAAPPVIDDAQGR
jgi:hypothetical protein